MTTSTTDVVADVQEHDADDFASGAVPRSHRRTIYQMIVVAVGWAISLSAFLVGGSLGGGLRFSQSVTAIVLGNAVLAVVASLIGLIGYRTGLTSYRVARTVFGSAGSVVVSLVLGVLAMGFIGVLADSFGGAFTALVPAVPWTVVVLVFMAAVTATAVMGFKGLAAISRVASPALLVLALLGLFRIAASEGGFGTAIDAVPADPISFDVGLTAVIATWITGAALTCDVSRYAQRGWHVVVATTIAYVVSAGFFEFTAMVSATEAGTSNFVVAMSSLGLLLPAVLVIVLALWTTTDNNLYSASLAFTSAANLLGWKVPKFVWVLISTAIATATAFMGFAGNFLSFLQVIAVVTPPFAGVVIAHFWVLGHIRTADASADGAALAGVRWLPLLSWVAASLTAHFVALPIEPVAALLIGGAVYSVLGLATGSRVGRVAEVPA